MAAHKKRCIRCGTEYYARADSELCSNACKQAVYRDRKAKRERESKQ